MNTACIFTAQIIHVYAIGLPHMTTDATASFTASGIRRGLLAGIPLAVSVLIYGLVFGILAKTAQMSMLEAIAMSAMVYSGSAQMVAVTQMAGGTVPVGTAALAVLTTILLLNARYLLYGAALRPWLGQVPAVPAYATLAVNGDGSWVLSMKAWADGERDAGFVFGSAIACFLPWIAGTAGGLLLGDLAANPKALGFDFLLVAFSAAIASGSFKGRGDLALVIAALAAAIAADRFLPSGWSILLAGLAAGIGAWITFRPEQQP
jgi:predicted branched-subunit amino acid permease